MTDGNIKDSLVYSSMKNILDNLIDYKDDLGSDANQRLININNYLDETTIKRACCMDKAGFKTTDGVNVRIPIPTGFDVTGNSDAVNKENLTSEFGFIDRKVFVDPKLCEKYPEYKKNSDKCDKFMNYYCQNIKKDFATMTNWDGSLSTFQGGKWNRFKPECSCYGEYPHIDYKNNGVAPKCVMPGCINSEYQDPVSRSNQCNNVICINSVDFNNLKAGGNIASNISLNSNCSAQEKNSTSTNPVTPSSPVTPSTPSTPPTPTPTPTPNSNPSPTPTPAPNSDPSPTPTPNPNSNPSPTPTPNPSPAPSSNSSKNNNTSNTNYFETTEGIVMFFIIFILIISCMISLLTKYKLISIIPVLLIIIITIIMVMRFNKLF